VSCDISWLQLGHFIAEQSAQRLAERRAALWTELAGALDPRLALRANDGPGGTGAPLSNARALRRTRRGALRRARQRLPHRLAHRDASADPGARAGGAAGGRRDRNRLRHLILRVARQVSDDPHADTLVEPFLQLVGQRDVLDLKALEREPEVGEDGPGLRRHRRGERVLIGGHVEKTALDLAGVGSAARQQRTQDL